MSGIFYEYLNIYFLNEVRIFYAVVDQLRAHKNELKTIYSLIGELDSLQSIASYRQGLDYCEPEFSEKRSLLEIEDMKHPLLTDPIPNSISINAKGVIITGSNMSGKTTFLRTLGVNAILAQTIHTCLASSYTGNYFRIISSINEIDDLIEGKSYYLVEAERLLEMIRSSENDVLTLCLIDEPLSGTNLAERISASLEILRYLINHNALVVASTHDLALPEQLKSFYKPYYFTDDVDDQGMKFDFRLKEGVSTTSNAIKLLKYLGYPNDLVDKAIKQMLNR